MSAESTPIDVLVVASWFPSVEDPTAGRFVADQAEALATSGLATPLVISFDAARLSGGARSRTQQEQAVLRHALPGVRQGSMPFVRPAWGVQPHVPVARFWVAEGRTHATGVDHAALHREAPLRAFADRLLTELAGLLDAPSGSVRRGVVHAHTAYPDGAAAAVLADRLGWPLFVTEHASFVERIISQPIVRARYAEVLARAEAVFAVSEMLGGELRAAFPEHADRIVVLPNAVPIELFRPVSADARRPDELLFVGYRKETKGIENLLRAVALAHARRPSITLRLIGRSLDAATEARWQALAAELGIAAIVAFDEPADRAGIAGAMARASLFVHPSPRETFGVVAVEALATGLPIVATDSGGVTEILGPEPGRFGALVPVDDPRALAEAIVETLERRASFDPAELRAAVERRFGAHFVTERIVDAYREALAESTSSGRRVNLASLGVARPAPADRLVVVALDRTRAAERLRWLPEALRARIDLVTAAAPSRVVLPDVRRVVEVAVETEWTPRAPARRAPPGVAGRLWRVVSDPAGSLRRRMGRDAGSAASLRPATAAVLRLAGEGGDATEIVPVDGHDHLAVAPVVASGAVRLSSGGIRHLADAWLASHDLADVAPADP